MLSGVTSTYDAGGQVGLGNAGLRVQTAELPLEHRHAAEAPVELVLGRAQDVEEVS